MKYAIAALLAATVAGECKVGNVGVFTEKTCTTKKEGVDKTATDAAAKAWTDAAATATGTCTDKKTVVCDATGITTTTFTDDACKTVDEANKATVLKWGECTAAGSDFIKVSGAKTVMAGAAALLAFAASQF